MSHPPPPFLHPLSKYSQSIYTYTSSCELRGVHFHTQSALHSHTHTHTVDTVTVHHWKIFLNKCTIFPANSHYHLKKQVESTVKYTWGLRPLRTPKADRPTHQPMCSGEAPMDYVEHSVCSVTCHNTYPTS